MKETRLSQCVDIQHKVDENYTKYSKIVTFIKGYTETDRERERERERERDAYVANTVRITRIEYFGNEFDPSAQGAYNSGALVYDVT